MASFAILGTAEATRGAGCRSLDKREKRKRPWSSDGHKTDRRSGMFSAAQLGWLMTQRAGRWSLDREKRRQPSRRDKRWKQYREWRPLPFLVLLKRLERLAAGV
ncbi:hypothetical protein [Planococcus donghaensis]|uniref:hypothetical protein n=1 Tax=Planococcus donghaensis TaxID=414778 RepID=UPI00373626F8